MLKALGPAVISAADSLHSQFRDARPFRHVVIDHFLDPAFAAELQTQFPSFDKRRALNEKGEVGGKAVFSDVASLGAAYARFDRLMKDRSFLDLIGKITGIPKLLYDPDYVGGGTHENLSGQELDTHVDFNYHPKLQSHRRLNLIVFLNPEWESDWGGCLELLPEPFATDGVRSVEPLSNRAVIFETTENSWHGFPRIQIPTDKQLSRRSLAVYFYTEGRPQEEVAPSHGTVYFQRPLPAHIQAGHTLTEGDVAELKTLLTRRDQYMQFLYHREQEFSEAIAGIAKSPSLKIAKMITWPGRMLRRARKS